MEENNSLEKIVDQEIIRNSTKKTILVDTIGNISYSLTVGILLDYCIGLNLAGIIASRASATAMNSVTGGPYGWWREKAFEITQTNEKSGGLKKGFVDLLAFNTFQVPIYAVALIMGSLVSEGEIDTEKVQNGTMYLASISVFIAPTLGWYMDGCRKLFNVKPATEGAYKKKL